MECECVGRGVNSGSCGGDGGAAENVAALSGGPLLTFKHEMVRAESCFPRRPRFVGVWEAVPVGELLGEAARGEERAGGYDREPFVVDKK